MAWCPKCKNEYREGITHCPDCDIDLVEELLPEQEEDFEIPEDFEFPEDFDPAAILDEPKEKPAYVKAYKSPEERYADMRSSAWTFVSVGGIGLVIMILALTGVLIFPFHDFALIVMLLLFAGFFAGGMVSFQSAKKLKLLAASEHAFIEKVTDWYHLEGIHAEAVTALDVSLPEELFYLRRYEAVSELIREHFPDIQEDLLNKLASDFCEEA